MSFLGWVFDMVMREPMVRFRQDIDHPYAAQEESLRRILAVNKTTDFGKQHGFSGLAAHHDADLWDRFRQNIPIRGYADFAPFLERMKNGDANVLIPGKPEMFSLTSGTTGEPKFCPVNRAFIKEHHRQHLLWMYNVYKSHPESNQGKYLVAASPAEMGRTRGGIPFGAMSGKQLDVQSIPVRRRMAAPADVQRLRDAEERWFHFLLFALAAENLSVVTAVNPSTLVSIADRLGGNAEPLLECLEKGLEALPKTRDSASPTSKRLASFFRPNPGRAKKLREIWKTDGALRPASVWPNLAVLLTWQGGSSSFYLPNVEAMWGSVPKRCLGLRASEGTFSIPLRDGDPSGTLAVGGHVMEFLPAEQGDPDPHSETLLANELEQGGLYRLIVTTSGGLYRYDLGDLVRVTGFDRRTPEVAFERRAGSVLSATGEKLTEDQVVMAMSFANADGPILNGFTLTWEMDGSTVRYVLAVECVESKDAPRSRRHMIMNQLEQVLFTFDEKLRELNCEYQSKREDGRLAPPRLILLADHSYDNLRTRLAAEGRPENQIKPPIMVQPPGPGKAPVKGCPFFDKVTIAIEPKPGLYEEKTVHME